jgi:hypothetical protein
VNIRAWPFEVKATVAIWIIAGVAALTFRWFDETKSVWPIAVGIWWVYNFYVAIQATVYKRLNIGFFACVWRMMIDADFREHSRKILSKPIWPPLTRHLQRGDKD